MAPESLQLRQSAVSITNFEQIWHLVQMTRSSKIYVPYIRDVIYGFNQNLEKDL